MKPHNKRMLDLMQYLISTREVATEAEFYTSIGFSWKNATLIKTGKQSFKIEHFINAGNRYGVSMDWFFGFTSDMRRKYPKLDEKRTVRGAGMQR